MGYYINPEEGTKERWLERWAIPLQEPRFLDPSEGSVAVCLINNGLFTAAGIAYSQREFEAFAEEDGRPKSWFEVAKSDLVAIGAIPEEMFE